jgi:hypothetical protein
MAVVLQEKLRKSLRTTINKTLIRLGENGMKCRRNGMKCLESGMNGLARE